MKWMIFALMCVTAAVNADSKDPGQVLERTSFQEAGTYNPKIDIRSDVTLVYGIGSDMPDRIRAWRDEGYRIHLMTGVSWGDYHDFLSGAWDGVNHEDAAQMDKNGNKIMHHPTVPYMCPIETYGKYLCLGVKRAIDAGAEAVCLEEPEFWVRGGYSEAFKREWEAYYKEPWIAPHTSPDAQYRASKLKYYLYRRALSDVFTFIRNYNRETGRNVKCYVATHSMINYAWWGIVSPESSLVKIDGCDGYIGQVWTGTARQINSYAGVQKERTFESAFFEYGVLHNLVRSTGKKMWYLNDPVEDNPRYCWEDYRQNWESTLVASLLWPDVWRYEVAPWPSRVFMGQYPKKNIRDLNPGEEVGKESIPSAYATELLTIFNKLNDQKQDKVSWSCGTRGLGVLVSDTMMFQRGEPNYGDGQFGSFFGLAMPLIKRGMPVEPVQLENAAAKEYLSPYRVLFLTYEGMKPPTPELHEALVKWVKSGGVLVIVDDRKDAYNSVKEWWNTAPMQYASPMDHLLEKLGVENTGSHRVGRGAVIYSGVSPASLSKSANGAAKTTALAKEACKLANLEWCESNHILLRRGPYVIGAGIDETGINSTYTINGTFINLFSPELEVVNRISLSPGARVFILDIGLV